MRQSAIRSERLQRQRHWRCCASDRGCRSATRDCLDSHSRPGPGTRAEILSNLPKSAHDRSSASASKSMKDKQSRIGSSAAGGCHDADPNARIRKAAMVTATGWQGTHSRCSRRWASPRRSRHDRTAMNAHVSPWGRGKASTYARKKLKTRLSARDYFHFTCSCLRWFDGGQWSERFGDRRRHADRR